MSDTKDKPSPKSKSQVFAARLFSTLLLWAIVTGVFLSDNAWAFMGLMSALSFFAAFEYFQMARKGDMPNQRSWGLTLTVAYLVVTGYILGTEGGDGLSQLFAVDALFVGLAVIGGLLLELRRPVQGKDTLVAIAVSVMGFIYVPVLFSYLARLLFLPEADAAVSGAWLVIWCVAVTKFTDMGAYITGSLIGKHKMIPHISPAKTWEGFAGALVFAQLAGCGLFAVLPQDLAILSGWSWVIGLGVLLALLAVVGDLAESVIKRSIGVKDSGQTLPGIGGALDLIDSLCFTAPVLYFVLLWLNA